MLKIKANAKEGFWRCGVKHPGEWVTHPDDRFSEKELKILKDEPMLSVVEVPEEKPKDNDKDNKKGKR